MLTISDLFDLEHTQAKEYLRHLTYPWEALAEIKSWTVAIGQRLGDSFQEIKEGVWVHSSAVIAPTAYVGAPCVIGAETEVRHAAFIRGSALIGEHCVVGNSVELKNVILFDGVQTPHYNYVGDSILGFRAHMGAGSITSNVKGDRMPVTVRCGQEQMATGLPKMGAMLGDDAEIGCNTVLNPGTIVGRNAQVYPLCSVRGTVPENSIYKNAGEIICKR